MEDINSSNNDNNNFSRNPIRLTIQCNNNNTGTRVRNDSMSTCSSTPLSPLSMSSSSFFPSSCPSSSLSPQSSSPPMSPMSKTPIPIDSPLFTKPPVDTSRRKRYKSFSKDARRARSFRNSRERSVVKPEDPAQTQVLKKGDTVSFLIKKSKFGKEGWKIMPEDGSFDLKTNGHILEQAVETVRHMLYAGHDIPNKISLIIQ